MGRLPLQKKYYLHVHDALKRAFPGATVHAFISNRHIFQSDMLLAQDEVLFDSEKKYMRSAASRLQRELPFVTINAFDQRLDLMFPQTKEDLSIQFGYPNVTIDHLNAEPDAEVRRMLRSSLGFDEERFTAAAPVKANLAAALLHKWNADNFPRDLCLVPVHYWLAQAYVFLQQFPEAEHHQSIFATIKDQFWRRYGSVPFHNPFCPGEDWNTLPAAAALCQMANPLLQQQVLLDGVSVEASRSVSLDGQLSEEAAALESEIKSPLRAKIFSLFPFASRRAQTLADDHAGSGGNVDGTRNSPSSSSSSVGSAEATTEESTENDAVARLRDYKKSEQARMGASGVWQGAAPMGIGTSGPPPNASSLENEERSNNNTSGNKPTTATTKGAWF